MRLQEVVMETTVEEVQFAEMITLKQESLALKNPKRKHWLKLLSLYHANRQFGKKNDAITKHMRYYFILHEAFWIEETTRKFSEGSLEDAVEFGMLGLEDGCYYDLAKLIQQKISESLLLRKLRENYARAKMERLIEAFNHDSQKGGYFFKQMRKMLKEVRHIRESYQRELWFAYDDYDVTYYSYTKWEQANPDRPSPEQMEFIYRTAQTSWNAQAAAKEDQGLRLDNYKRSLFELEAKNVAQLPETIVLFYIDQLQSERDKLWFLRRICLNFRQCAKEYLRTAEMYYRNDEEEVINIYRGVIAVLEDKSLEVKYLYFLLRRINRHLSGEQDEEYNSSWGGKVVLFRQQIEQLMSKQRLNNVEQVEAYETLEKIALEAEKTIIKDKAAVERIYEYKLKINNAVPVYEEYSRSLIEMQAYGDAGNVLRRCFEAHQTSDEYRKFLGFYGTIEQEVLFEQKVNNKKAEDIQIELDLNKCDGAPLEKEGHIKGAVNGEIKKQKEQMEQKKQKDQKVEVRPSFLAAEENMGIVRLREQIDDETTLKIETQQRKRVHVDSSNTLFVSSIDTSWTESDILARLKYPKEVSQIRLVVKNKQKRDYCYIDYSEEESAAREMRENSQLKMAVSRPPGMYDESNTLFLCALPATATEEKIKALFREFKVKQVRLKLSKDKNIAYVDCEQNRQLVYDQMQKEKLVIDGKKIIMQLCDSDRRRNNKFVKVVFLKNLAFKAKEEDVRNFFKGRAVSKMTIARDDNGKSKGFAYVEFQSFKDYQHVLDMRAGSLFGREFLIFKSDRQIRSPNPKNDEQLKEQYKEQGSSKRQHRPPTDHRHSRSEREHIGKQGENSNNFFSSLFK